MVVARVTFAAVLALSLASLAPAYAAEGASTHSGAASQLYKALAWGGRKVLARGGPSRIIVNGVVVFESRPDKMPTRPADAAQPAVNASPPPSALRSSSVAADNPRRDTVNDNLPPSTPLTRPAAPDLAIPPLPPRLAEHERDLGYSSSPPSYVGYPPPKVDDHGGDARGCGSPGGKDDKGGSPSGRDDRSGSPSGKDDKSDDDDKSSGKGKGGGKD